MPWCSVGSPLLQKTQKRMPWCLPLLSLAQRVSTPPVPLTECGAPASSAVGMSEVTQDSHVHRKYVTFSLCLRECQAHWDGKHP